MSHSMTEQDLQVQRQAGEAPAAPPVEQTQRRQPEQAEQAAEQTQPREHAQPGSDEHETMDTGQVPGTAAMSAQFAERPSDAAIAEIEAERERRLHNRPPNAEVDNTHRKFNSEIGRFEDCEDPIHFEKHHRR